MGIFKRLFGKTKEVIIHRKLSSKEQWCKNFVDKKNHFEKKPHSDVGKIVWARVFNLKLRDYEKKKCEILAYREGCDPDGSYYRFIVKYDNGVYNEISSNSYFYEEPEEWVWDLDYLKRNRYISIEKRLLELEKYSSKPFPTDEENVEILKVKNSLRELKPILSKSELREKRLSDLLD